MAQKLRTYNTSYDNMERLLTVTVRHDGAAAVTLCSNTYNALGQLASQSLGQSAQGTVDYTYNVRGWTTSIVSPPFKQYLHYQDTYGTATPCWNGNISAMEWESLDALLATQPARHSYAYTYDGLNRLTAAAHEAVDYDEWSDRLMMSNEPDYSCTYGYDLNGNMTSLTRHGVNVKVNVFNNEAWHFGEIDHLSMTYDGNRLRKVTDQCAELTYAGAMDFKDGIDKQEEYLWDANGNMTRDRNKGIYEICYNVLNLPERIRYYDGHEVQYTYAADGRKLHVDYLLNLFAIIDDDGGGLDPIPHPINGQTGNLLGGGDGLNGGLPGQIDPIVFEPQVLMTRDWCGGHLYRNGALERIENAYGYWADSCYHYRITDYQGNVRAVISQNGVLEEVNGYYPYGGLLGAPATGVQARKYGGKELDRENGLDWLDFEARHYDPMLPQFNSIDRKAEDYPGTSPFAYCAGNPIRNIDPTGMFYLDSNSEFETDKDYKVLVIFSSTLKDEDKKLENDYKVAVSSGVPVMVVENMEDLVAGLSHMTKILNCKFENVSLNDHGRAGILNIGKKTYDSNTDFSSLNPFFKDKNIFIEACNNGVGTDGSKLTEKLAKDTQSTVISSMHPVNKNYHYDGSKGLNSSILSSPFYNLYKISHYGSKSTIIKDFSIDKNKGFCWKIF